MAKNHEKDTTIMLWLKGYRVGKVTEDKAGMTAYSIIAKTRIALEAGDRDSWIIYSSEAGLPPFPQWVLGISCIIISTASRGISWSTKTCVMLRIVVLAFSSPNPSQAFI